MDHDIVMDPDGTLWKWIRTPEAKKSRLRHKKTRGKRFSSNILAPTGATLKYRRCFQKTAQLSRRYFSKAIQAYRLVFLAQIRDIRALK